MVGFCVSHYLTCNPDNVVIPGPGARATVLKPPGFRKVRVRRDDRYHLEWLRQSDCREVRGHKPGWVPEWEQGSWSPGWMLAVQRLEWFGFDPGSGVMSGAMRASGFQGLDLSHNSLISLGHIRCGRNSVAEREITG